MRFIKSIVCKIFKTKFPVAIKWHESIFSELVKLNSPPIISHKILDLSIPLFATFVSEKLNKPHDSEFCVNLLPNTYMKSQR
jgi:hypothetical protein